MLKSIRMDPKPQPPAAASAWMMPSEVALLESVEMSVFHGFGASKSRPGMVVVVTDVVVGREVEVDVLDGRRSLDDGRSRMCRRARDDMAPATDCVVCGPPTPGRASCDRRAQHEHPRKRCKRRARRGDAPYTSRSPM